MQHRHLTTQEWTLMAIESLFDRGQLEDWREFAAALRADAALAERTLHVCDYRKPDGAEGIARALISATVRPGKSGSPQAILTREPVSNSREVKVNSAAADSGVAG